MPETDAQDLELIYELSRAHSLAEKPGKNNWIEKTSDEGLPDYISRIAKALIRSGKSKSTAIAIAISRVKAWAAGGDNVDVDTRAKAAAAVAAWEKLKASNKARSASKKVAMSNSRGKLEQVISPYELLSLSVSYSMDSIRAQFTQKVTDARRARRSVTPDYASDPWDYLYVKEVWTDYLIVTGDYGDSSKKYRVDYTVDKNGNATFSDPVEVMTKYVTVKQLADSEGEYASLTAENVESFLEADRKAELAGYFNTASKISQKLGK